MKGKVISREGITPPNTKNYSTSLYSRRVKPISEHNSYLAKKEKAMFKILVIDDQEDDRVVTSALLESVLPGIEIITAQNGMEGFKLARDVQPDVILLDLYMPGIDGYQVCKILKTHEDTRIIPLIILTSAGPDQKFRIKSLETGADAFLSKPVNKFELAAQVKVMLKIKESEDKLREDKVLLRKMVYRKNRELKSQIDERKHVEESLQETEKRYKVLFDTAADGIYIHDYDGRLLDFNRVAHERLEYSSEEFIGITFQEIEGEKFNFFSSQALKELEEKGHIVRETYHKTCSGKLIPVELSCKRIDYDGRPAILSIARDITRRKEMETQLRQAQKMEAIGTLAGGIAHDFNNILGIISGYAELLRSDVASIERAAKKINNILTASQRAKNLIRQILTFSSQAEPVLSPVEINSIIKEAVDLLRGSLPSNIEFILDLPDSPSIIMGDATQFQQIIMNLCVNAGHAMKEKGGILRISLVKNNIEEGYLRNKDLVPGPYFKLSVEDTGCGMPPDVLKRIFDPFFTTRSAGQGTGLGLSVVHGIVKSFGGNISVNSEPEKGTCFDILIPTSESSAVDTIEEQVQLPGGSEHILFVDDEEELMDMGRQILETLGYKVTTRSSSIDALKCFKEHPERFDLIMCDLTMPNMSGIKLARELNQIRPGIPVIVCSGFSASVNPDFLKDSGISRIALKPLVQKDVAFIIRDVIDHNLTTTK